MNFTLGYMTNLLQALLTPTIAIVMTYVAYQQYRIRRDERAMVLYERRLTIFRNAIGIVDRVRAGNAITTEEVFSWANSMTETPFLFGKEVETVIDAIFGALYDYAVESEPVTRGKPYNTSCANLAVDVEAFRTPLIDVFSPYLCPSGSSLWTKRRLSIKQASKLVSEVSSSKGTETSSGTSTDDKLEGDIPF